MKFLDKTQASLLMNQLGKERTPFLFIISFDTLKNVVVPLDEIDSLKIAYDFQGLQNNLGAFHETYPLNAQDNTLLKISPTWQCEPISFAEYRKAFTPLMKALQAKTTDLANLTFPTPIKCNLTLPEIFARTSAKYRIFLKDHFCAFSPETFITIKDHVIATYPMKGTINASIPNAENLLLENPKELNEHQTVAKEALKDIALVAKNARISRFRYVDHVARGDGEILQTSSIIEGDLETNYHETIGDLLYNLLPAGSITGSPKKITTQILSTIETYQRGFYSGVAGIYDGHNLDSTVLIRYLEKSRSNSDAIKPSIKETTFSTISPIKDQNNQFLYTFKSGGGITAMSHAKSEYDELIEKIYLPIS